MNIFIKFSLILSSTQYTHLYSQSSYQQNTSNRYTMLKQKLELEGEQQNSFKRPFTVLSDKLCDLQLRCPSGLIASKYCMSCKNCAVACQSINCKGCYNNHKNCQRNKVIKNFNEYIDEKLIQSQIGEHIGVRVKKIIEQIRPIPIKIKQQYQEVHLNFCDKRIANKIRNYYMDKRSKITGEDFQRFCSQSQKQEKNWFQNSWNILHKSINSARQSVLKQFQQIEKLMFNQLKFNSTKLNELIFKNSNILKDLKTKKQMFNMMEHLFPIQKIQRVYCATDNNFSVGSFHLSCQKKKHLLYLVQNQYGKIYGGYSPCLVQQYKGKLFQRDSSKNSFIFSLSQRVKSMLVNQEKAIRNSTQIEQKSISTFVSFGDQKNINLCISENSYSVQKQNWIHFESDAYEKIQVDFKDINGYEEKPNEILDKCKLNQFEVFQVIFQRKY